LFSKYGTPYVLNLIPGWQHDAVNAMGCRTRLSGDWADAQGYDNPRYSTMRTGNIQYITLNLPRLAYRAKGNPSVFFDNLDSMMEVARDAVSAKHQIVEANLASGVLPFLSQKGKDGETYYQFDDLTHTLGFVGLNECLMSLYGVELQNGVDKGIEIIKHMRNFVDAETTKTGQRWTLTQSPAETTAGRFAALDLLEYKDQVIANGLDTTPYYTNSSHLNVKADVSLGERAITEGLFHPLCNGGHITHLFMGEGTPNPEGLMSLTRKLCHSTDLGLFDYTKDITVCKSCGAVLGGLQNSCASCGSNSVEWYSRITGYCQRIGHGGTKNGWNPAKIAELKDRRRY
jgi:ribonucleoside-triphosphate reductase